MHLKLINKLINTCKLYVKQHSAISMNLFETQIKSGEFQVTFECKNSNITHEVIAELKKNGYMIEISDHNENYITIYWR